MGAFAPGIASDIGSLVLEDCPTFVPCFEDLEDFSLLDLRVKPGLRDCEEEGLSRGDLGVGITVVASGLLSLGRSDNQCRALELV